MFSEIAEFDAFALDFENCLDSGKYGLLIKFHEILTGSDYCFIPDLNMTLDNECKQTE